jgi:Phosphatidyl serine synthase
MANLTDAMDMFVVAHLAGWMVKMFALRDFKLAMIQ